jgi:hypothetical protein
MASPRPNPPVARSRLRSSWGTPQLTLPRPEFKRAQILEFDGVAIAQVNYLDTLHSPMAPCVTHSNSDQRDFAQKRQHEMNIVYWSDMEHA